MACDWPFLWTIFLLMSHKDTFTRDKDCFLATLQRLGWWVNWDKSPLDSSTNKVFIGYNVLTSTREGIPIIKITSQRMHKLKRDIKRLLASAHVTARVLSRVEGQCISITKVILPAKLLRRNVYRVLKQRASWETPLCLDMAAKTDLEYWLASVEAWNVRISVTKPVDVQAVSDASSTGWGFACLNQEAAGFWDVDVPTTIQCPLDGSSVDEYTLILGGTNRQICANPIRQCEHSGQHKFSRQSKPCSDTSLPGVNLCMPNAVGKRRDDNRC